MKLLAGSPGPAVPKMRFSGQCLTLGANTFGGATIRTITLPYGSNLFTYSVESSSEGLRASFFPPIRPENTNTNPPTQRRGVVFPKRATISWTPQSPIPATDSPFTPTDLTDISGYVTSIQQNRHIILTAPNTIFQQNNEDLNPGAFIILNRYSLPHYARVSRVQSISSTHHILTMDRPIFVTGMISHAHSCGASRYEANSPAAPLSNHYFQSSLSNTICGLRFQTFRTQRP